MLLWRTVLELRLWLYACKAFFFKLCVLQIAVYIFSFFLKYQLSFRSVNSFLVPVISEMTWQLQYALNSQQEANNKRSIFFYHLCFWMVALQQRIMTCFLGATVFMVWWWDPGVGFKRPHGCMSFPQGGAVLQFLKKCGCSLIKCAQYSS